MCFPILQIFWYVICPENIATIFVRSLKIGWKVAQRVSMFNIYLVLVLVLLLLLVPSFQFGVGHPIIMAILVGSEYVPID